MPGKSDTDLIQTEEVIHDLLTVAEARGEDLLPLIKAHDALTDEMRNRGLVYTPLGKRATTPAKVFNPLPADPHTEHGYDPDEDGSDDTTNDENDYDNDGGVYQGSDDAPGSELREPTERQKPRKRNDIRWQDGPVVKKAYNPDEPRGEGGKWTSGSGSGSKRGRGMTRQEGLDNGQLVDTGHGTDVRSNHPGNGWGPEPLERLRQGSRPRKDAMDTSSSDMEGSEPSHGYNPDSQPRAGDAVRAQNAAHGGPRPLHKIASEIRRDWASQKGGINFAAKPYLDALSGLDEISDNYGADSAHTIVSYLLGNMSQWKGETAKRVKSELKGMLKVKKAMGMGTCSNCDAKSAPGKTMCWKCYGANASKMTKDSGAPPSFTHPEDDPYISRKGTKSGKGGDRNRLKPKKVTGTVDNDTDDKNPGDLGYITAIKKGMATPHAFDPVRNICKNCKGGSESHGDGMDHDFIPVRNICKTCKNGSEMHKAVGYDPILKTVAQEEDPDFWVFFKSLPQLSTADRATMAEQGIALPDGSFPIPNEAHLHAAIRLVGQAQDPQSAMNHIIERAHAMGLQHALPPAWNVSSDPSQGVAAVGEGAHAMGGPNEGQPMTASNAGPVPAGSGHEAMESGSEEEQEHAMGGDEGSEMEGWNAAGGAGAGSAPKAPGEDAQDRQQMQSQTGMQEQSSVVASTPTPKKPKGATPLSGTGPSKPGLMKRLASAFQTSDKPDIDLDEDFSYAVVKSVGEKRYTLGPVYMPGQLDAHGEWATAEDLQHATWDFVKSAEDRSVYLQHSERPAGEWVEIMAWPHPVTAAMTKSRNAPVEFPAGTVYMGVQWEPWAWSMVKEGQITGFSMGGWAQRVEGMPG